jgi:hypothetical protein
MPMLWRAKLPVKTKLSLIGLFGGGVFVMMAGILRCILIIKVSDGTQKKRRAAAFHHHFLSFTPLGTVN